jgi:hypothetical protein
MNFRIRGLEAGQFSYLFALSEAELAAAFLRRSMREERSTVFRMADLAKWVVADCFELGKHDAFGGPAA